MARQHGVTSTTFTEIIIDSGAVYKNYGESGQALLGATRGGNTFTIETEYREMEVDGARGAVKSGRRITGVVCSVVANFLAIDKDTILQNLTGAAAADITTHYRITRSLQLTDSAYLTNVAIVGEVPGKTNSVICRIDNAISDAGFEFAFTDKDETILATTFKAHFDPSDLDTEPWAISYPQT